MSIRRVVRFCSCAIKRMSTEDQKMFDNVVETQAKRIIAATAASLVSTETLAYFAEEIRNVVNQFALMRLSPEFSVTLTLRDGEIFVGQVTDEIHPETGEPDDFYAFNFSAFRSVRVEADHLDLDQMSWPFGVFGDDPFSPSEAVFGADVLVYALLHELTGASYSALAKTYALEQGIDFFGRGHEEMPDRVRCLSNEAMSYYREHFSREAQDARYGTGYED